MIATWVLIFMIGLGGGQGGPAVIDGFRTELACRVAANQIKDIYEAGGWNEPSARLFRCIRVER